MALTGTQVVLDAAEEVAAKRRCEALFETFDAQAAALADMRAYARCVELVHGLSDRAPPPAWPLLLLGGIGCVIGLRHAARHEVELDEALFFGIAGGAIGSMSGMGVVILLRGLWA
jgi:hypothetical protein